MGVVMYVWFLGLLALVAGSPLQRDFPEYSAELVRKINAMDTTWKAGPNFVGESAKSVLDRLRIKEQPQAEKVRVDVPVKNTVDLEAAKLDEFDSRKSWPRCNATIGHIFDQGRCLAGWVIPAVGAMRDRYCITFGQMFNFSVVDAHCIYPGDTDSSRCDGDEVEGNSLGVWLILRDFGYVSGGDWNSTSGCLPYPYRPCDHYEDGTYGPCQNPPPTNASLCIQKCRPGYPVNYHKDLKRAKGVLQPGTEEDIKTMIYTSGPVSAEISLYKDLLTYRSGVYHQTSNGAGYLGKHGVKIIGWGEENGTKYWLCTNSWNDQWGDKGYVKIRRGTNEVNIESFVYAGYFK